MAKFTLSNVSIRKVGQTYNEQGQPVGQPKANVFNAGREYIYGSLLNNDCPWEGSITYTSFNANAVNYLRQFVPASRGGNATEEKELPAAYANILGETVAVKAPAPFHKKHLSGHAATATRAAIMAGDLVRDENGNPRVYDTLTVFCQYYFSSDTNEKQYVTGCFPANVFEQQFKAFCVSCGNNTATTETQQPSLDVLPM